MKRLFFWISAVLVACSAQASILETVELKDGTILKGYTAGMDKSGQTIFMAEQVSKSIPSAEVWQQERDASNSQITKVTTKDGTFNALDIEEKDGKFTFFMKNDNVADQRIVINASNPIIKYTRPMVDPDQITGMLDRVVSKPGTADQREAIGVVTTQIPGGYWEVTTRDGKTIRFASNDVDVYEKVPISDSGFFKDNSPLIDTYTLKDGTQVKGALKKKDWTTNEITIINGTQEQVLKNADIVEFKSEPNKDFVLEIDRGLESDDVVMLNNVSYNLEEIEVKGHELKVPIHDIVITSEDNQLKVVTSRENNGMALFKVKPEFIEKKKRLFDKIGDFFDNKKIRTADIPRVELDLVNGVSRTRKKTITTVYDINDCGYYLLKNERQVREDRKLKGTYSKLILFRIDGCNNVQGEPYEQVEQVSQQQYQPEVVEKKDPAQELKDAVKPLEPKEKETMTEPVEEPVAQPSKKMMADPAPAGADVPASPKNKNRKITNRSNPNTNRSPEP